MSKRRYYKKPRIIDEVALPAGLFPGTSKITFDVLHQAMATAHAQGRQLQLTKRKLLEMTSIKSVTTLFGHLKYFRTLQLVTVDVVQGDQRGNFYAVHVEKIPAAINALNGTRPKLGASTKLPAV
jgi:hypothetical protein